VRADGVQFPTIHVWEHQVESHQVRRLTLNRFERGLPVTRNGGLIARVLQVNGYHFIKQAACRKNSVTLFQYCSGAQL
jgi:hypothetical protein